MAMTTLITKTTTAYQCKWKEQKELCRQQQQRKDFLVSFACQLPDKSVQTERREVLQIDRIKTLSIVKFVILYVDNNNKYDIIVIE